jgi:hypothetical protein
MRKLKSVALIAVTVGCALVPAAHAQSTAASSAYDQYLGKTCTGSMYMETLNSQSDYAGQTIRLVAKFFRKRDGSPGVSFRFGSRASVDLSVSPRDDGLDFIGQYGGRYSLKYAGANHISGHQLPPTPGSFELSCR